MPLTIEKHPWIVVGALMIFACALSLLLFAHQSLRLDEAQSLWQSSRSPVDILTIVGQDVHVPLYHELLHFWRLYAGDSVAWARGFSLLWFVLSIPALYLLGQYAYNRSAGLLAATLLAVSPFMNWYGAEVRMYTLFMFLAIINQYAFLRLWKGGTQTRDGTEHAWAVYMLTAILGVFTHYFFFLILLSQAVLYLLRQTLFPRGSLKKFIVAAGVIAAILVPWLLWVALQGQIFNQAPALPRPTTVDLFNALSQFVFGFQDDHLNTVILSLWPLSLMFGFFALRHSERMSPQTEYLLLSVVLPIIAVFLISLALPLFVSRYLIFTVPSVYLLITSLVSTYPERAGKWARAGLVGAMAVMLLIEISNPSTPVKEDYRAAALYLNENSNSQDIIALSAPFTIYPIEYYYRGPSALSTLPLWDSYAHGPIPAFSASSLPTQVSQTTQGHQNVWLLLSYDQGYETQIKDYFDSHYQKLASVNFSPGLDLYEYQVRYDTPLGRDTALK